MAGSVYNREISDRCSSNTRHIEREEEVEGPIQTEYGFPLVTPTQRRRYPLLAMRIIAPTKFLDPEVLTTMGLKNDFDWFLPNMNWETFMAEHEPTYAPLTMEFLSSFNAPLLNQLDENEDGGFVRIRLCNRQYCLSMPDWNELLGLPANGFLPTPNSANFSLAQWWQNITVPNSPHLYPYRNDVTFMPNPVFRYLHRVIAESLFSNGEYRNTASPEELKFMTTNIYAFKYNTGAYLADHLVKVAQGNVGYDGDITIGGRITTIARRLLINLDYLAPVPGKTRIDLQCCLESGIVEEEGGVYYLPEQHDGYQRIRLPNPPRLTIGREQNWKFPGQNYRRP
ncbi:hypothetical protein OROGR_026529 [Orobanche gracilis]